MIKQITSDSELHESLNIIRTSFLTETGKFGITEQNCPVHPAYMAFEQLKELKAKGNLMFGLFESQRQVGFVSIRPKDDRSFSLEKLSVLPEYRHKGLGRKLVQFVFDYARKQEGNIVSLALVNEHAILKNWYQQFGFKETEIKRYDHLPFTVCFMEADMNMTNELTSLETKRLVLRKYREDDFQAVHEYGSDPEVTRFVPFGPNTLEDTQGFMDRTLSSYSDPDSKELKWAITLNDTGQLIGGGGIRIGKEENASIGYVLNRRFWGKGYATETANALLTFGFTRLNLHRMVATCDPENWASAHVMEKIGMRREGHFMEDVQIRGEWRNSYLYAILEKEWKEFINK